MKVKRAHMKKKKLLFHLDNASPRTSLVAMSKINDLRFELLPHPPYSPDLAPSDYYLFPNLKRWLQGMGSYSNEEVVAETDEYFADLGSDYYKKGIEMLEDRCIVLEGNYVEE